MYRDENSDTEIRNNWFDNHIATLRQEGNLQVLDWRDKNGSSFYYVRYVFDGNKLYISGDLGEAIFCFTSPVGIDSFMNFYLDYFYGKLAAFSDKKVDFNSDEALRIIKQWETDLIEDDVDFDRDVMKELINSVSYCYDVRDLVELVNDTYHDFIAELSRDYWEWIYQIGDQIPIRIQSYLIGLKMALEQLKTK